VKSWRKKTCEIVGKLEKRQQIRKMRKTLGTPVKIWNFLGKPWVIFVGQPNGELGETLGNL